jgi:hypothetical protein
VFLAFLIGVPLFSQNRSERDFAFIVFKGDKSDNSNTYLGKVKKGDPSRLRSELGYSSSYSGNESIEKRGPNTDAESYIRYLSRQEKKKNRKQFRHLSDWYSVDEQKLAEGNKRQSQKYFEEKELMFTEKEKLKAPKNKKKSSKVLSFEEFQQLNKDQSRPNTYLAKNYKIKGNKLRKGKKFKHQSGPVSLLIKYKIKEGNMVRTYIDMVDAHLKPGSLYELKYHGEGAGRQYYLEYQQVPKPKEKR